MSRWLRKYRVSVLLINKKKSKKCVPYGGITGPMGILYAILLSLILLAVVVYFSWSYSISVIENQRVHSIVLTAGTPYGFYNVSNNRLVFVFVPAINPSPRVVVLKELIIAGVRIPLDEVMNDTSLDPSERKSIVLGWDVLRNYNITVANFVEEMFIEGTLVTDIGSVTFPIILHGVK